VTERAASGARSRHRIFPSKGIDEDDLVVLREWIHAAEDPAIGATAVLFEAQTWLNGTMTRLWISMSVATG
jgi:hypothetical protein